MNTDYQRQKMSESLAFRLNQPHNRIRQILDHLDRDGHLGDLPGPTAAPAPPPPGRPAPGIPARAKTEAPPPPGLLRRRKTVSSRPVS